MSSEKQMWTALQPWMKKLNLDPVRVENRVAVGVPDVNYLHGWLELKHSDGLQRNSTLRLKHPPAQAQKVWLMRRWRLGGTALLCLRINRLWFLFPGDRVWDIWATPKTVPHLRELNEQALIVCDTPKQLAEFLVGYRHET